MSSSQSSRSGSVRSRLSRSPSLERSVDVESELRRSLSRRIRSISIQRQQHDISISREHHQLLSQLLLRRMIRRERFEEFRRFERREGVVLEGGFVDEMGDVGSHLSDGIGFDLRRLGMRFGEGSEFVLQ